MRVRRTFTEPLPGVPVPFTLLAGVGERSDRPDDDHQRRLIFESGVTRSRRQGRTIKTLASHLAWDIYERYSRWGQPIDVVAHSMGGLIVRAAITGVQKGEFGARGTGFPPYVYVEDVATLSTPHRGTDIAALCAIAAPTKQCIDMSPGSSFQAWLGGNPQATGIGTDWTLLGSEGDFVVHPASALASRAFGVSYANMPVGHKILYKAPQPQLPLMLHEDIMDYVGGPFVMKYCDFFNTGCNMADADADAGGLGRPCHGRLRADSDGTPRHPSNLVAVSKRSAVTR